MKKLLHLQLLPLMSGVQRFSLHLLEGLDKSEFEIWVACRPGGEFVDEIQQCGYHYLPLPCLHHEISAWDGPALLHLLYLIKKHNFDIVHTNSSKPGLLGRLAASLLKVPVIVHTAHGTAFQDEQPCWQQKILMALEAMGNSLGKKTVFVNDSDRICCLQHKLIAPHKASTIYNALPPRQEMQLKELAQQRTVASSELVIGSTLRFSHQKNVIALVTAACRACQMEPKLKFILVGNGEHEQLCRVIIGSYKLNERILLPGWDSEVLPWLRLFDVFVLYSRWEAMPFSIIEAMVSGLPVIGSHIPSIAELVDESCGWLVSLDDQQGLIDSFVQVARDPHEVYAKGQQAAQKIVAKCNYAQMIAAYRRLYLQGQQEQAQ